MSLLPDDDRARKMLPMFRMIVGYFPKALREVTRVCVANNVRYNPERAPADINWARGKSTDQMGSAFRHMLESTVDGKIFEAVPPEVTAATGIERVYILAEAMWRIGAALELQIEEVERSQLLGVQSLGAKGPVGPSCEVQHHGDSHQACEQRQVHEKDDRLAERQADEQRCKPGLALQIGSYSQRS